MKTYIGTKIIEAKPMTAEDAPGLLKRRVCIDNAEKLVIDIDNHDQPYFSEDDDGQFYVTPGYLVKYQNGYRSWLPKKQFEESYDEMMGTYIATKIIKATLMGAHQASAVLNRRLSLENAEKTDAGYPGYFVEYSDGYQSWLPKKQFEESHSLLKDIPADDGKIVD